MRASLGHRERVLRTIEGRDIDRIPFFFRAEPPVKERLKKEFNLESEMDLISYFDADAIHIGVSYKRECFRQLMLAWDFYNDDNDGRIVNGDTEEYKVDPAEPCWVRKDWVQSGQPDLSLDAKKQAIKDGAL